MPKISRKTSTVEEREPFGVYDGPEVPRGNYPAIVRSVVAKTAKSGNTYLNVLTVLDSPEEAPKAVYNGAPIYTIITLTDVEANMQREQAFYLAICGKADVDIVTDDKDTVARIGGKNPVGVAVRVDVRPEEYPPGSGNYQAKGDSIYKATAGEKTRARTAEVAADPDAADPDLGESESQAAATPAVTVEAEAKPKRNLSVVKEEPAEESAAEGDDYHSLTLPKLKMFAKDKGIDITGLNKAAILTALDAKFNTAGADADGKKTPDEVRAMTQEQLVAWIEPWYDEDDLEGMERDEVVEMLIDESIIKPF